MNLIFANLKLSTRFFITRAGVSLKKFLKHPQLYWDCNRGSFRYSVSWDNQKFDNQNNRSTIVEIPALSCDRPNLKLFHQIYCIFTNFPSWDEKECSSVYQIVDVLTLEGVWNRKRKISVFKKSYFSQFDFSLCSSRDSILYEIHHHAPGTMW